MRAKIPTLVRTFACKILSKVRAKVGTRIGTFAYNITGRDKKRREKNRREQDLCAAVAALSARSRPFQKIKARHQNGKQPHSRQRRCTKRTRG